LARHHTVRRCRREIEMSYPERSRSVRFGPAVPDSHVSVGHPFGVAPERVSKAEATDGSVRDRQKPFDSLVGGLFHFAITAVSSRAEALDVNARSAGLGFARRSEFQAFRLESRRTFHNG
jgi:hypothetical protein